MINFKFISCVFLSAVVLCLAASSQSVDSSVNYVAPQVWKSARNVHSSNNPVSVTSFEADVDILEGVAVTKLLIKMQNSSRRSEEAVLLLPAPADAAIRSFDFNGAAAEPKVELLPVVEAKKTYSSMVAKLRDPALLEFAGCSLIRTSVFPVPAHGEQVITITYEQILKLNGGALEYILPRTQRLADSTIPFLLKARIKSASPISSAYSPTHPIRTERINSREIRISLESKGSPEPGSFLLEILPDSGDMSAALLAYPSPSEKGGYFLLFAGLPGDSKLKSEKVVKREVTLVLDRSGYMKGDKIKQAKAALLQVLQSLEYGETFNILIYNDVVERFSSRSVVKDPKTESDARAYISAIEAQGGTNLHDAVVAALTPNPRQKMLPVVILISDGLPTVGVTLERDIRSASKAANKHGRRIFTFGVGSDVNVPLLDYISIGSRGSMTCVLPAENVEAKVSTMFAKLNGPIFISPSMINIDPEGNITTRAVIDVLPRTLPDLYKGDRMVVMGRYYGDDPLRFKLSGEYLGDQRSFEFSFNLSKASVKNAFVPRLWASRLIALHIDELRQSGAGNPAVAGLSNSRSAISSSLVGVSSSSSSNLTRGDVPVDPKTKELVDEIVRLSIEFGILTEYTSFLAVEGTDLSENDKLVHDANSNINEWAVGKRSGSHAISMQNNYSNQRAQTVLNGRNDFYDEEMNVIEFATVQQVADLAFFKRGSRWIDSRVVDRKGEIKPDEEVDFGSVRFYEIFQKLVSNHRQGVLSLGGAALFEMDGKVIRVKFPASKISSQQSHYQK